MMPHKALCRDHERIYSSSPTDKKQCWGFGVLILCDIHPFPLPSLANSLYFCMRDELEAKMEKVGQRKENLCQALVFTIIMVGDDEFISAPKPLKKRPSDKSHLNQVINVKILQRVELIYSVAYKKKQKYDSRNERTGLNCVSLLKRVIFYHEHVRLTSLLIYVNNTVLLPISIWNQESCKEFTFLKIQANVWILPEKRSEVDYNFITYIFCWVAY